MQESFVASFVDIDKYEELTSAFALRALCGQRYWDKTARYLPLISDIIASPPAKENTLLQSTAFEVLGSYLGRFHDRAAIGLLLDSFEKERKQYAISGDRKVRNKLNDAYLALQQAFSHNGITAESWLSWNKPKYRFPDDVDETLLLKARNSIA